MKTKIVLLSLCLLTGVAHAQNTVKADQGKPGNQGPWPVTGTLTCNTIFDGGAVSIPYPVPVVGIDAGGVFVQDVPCTGAVESVVVQDGGTTAVLAPHAALAARRTITLCNSPKNTGTPLWTLRIDGVDPTTAATAAGQTLNKSDCITYTLQSTVPVRVIGDTGNSALTITECK